MQNLENFINDLVTKLFIEGSAEFSQDGLTIKASKNGDILQLSASFEEKDSAKQLRDEFEDYVKELSDDFFIEIAESFKPGQLKDIQDRIDSDDYSKVMSGVNDFMSKANHIAWSKIVSLDKDIKEVKEDLEELQELRASYQAVFEKRF